MLLNPKPVHATWVKSLAFVAGGVAVIALGLAARAQISHWTRVRVEQSLVRQIAALDESDAAALVLGCDSLDRQAIPALAAALADPRPAVADSAEQAIGRFVAEWRLLPADEAAPRVAILAEHLAAHCDRMALARRPWLRDLAARLLVWPGQSQSDLAVATIAHCETILRLPPPTEVDLRIAARPRPSEAEEPAFPAPHPGTLAPPLPQSLPLAETPLPAPSRDPGPRDPAEPARLPGASRETPLEPRQFLAPRAEKLPSP